MSGLAITSIVSLVTFVLSLGFWAFAGWNYLRLTMRLPTSPPPQREALQAAINNFLKIVQDRTLFTTIAGTSVASIASGIPHFLHLR